MEYSYDYYKACSEVILHSMLCNYLDGEYDKAKDDLVILRRFNKECSDAIADLSDLEIKRLKKISHALDNNIKVKTYDIEHLDNEEQHTKQDEKEIREKYKHEKNIHTLIIDNFDKLSHTLKMPDLKLYAMEMKTPYGNVDIEARWGKYAIPIEVKLGKATFKIVSQIDKYMKHYLKKTNIGHWDDVVGVTIALEYDKYALEELKQNGVRVIQYFIYNNEISFKRLK